MRFISIRKYGYVLGLLVYALLMHLLVALEKSTEGANIKSIYDAIWYSLVTLTTVGYGDYYPVSPIGKILGVFIIVSSLGILGYLIGSISNKIRTYMEKKKEGYYGTNFTSHFVIIGWNNFAKLVTKQITNAKHRVVIVTNNKDDIDQINEQFKPTDAFVLFTDYSNYTSFNKANINEAQSVFVNLSDDSEAMVLLINMKKLFPGANYVVTINKPDLKSTYHSLGIENVISKNEIASKLVASIIFEPQVGQYTEDLIATSVDDGDYDIQQYKVVEANPYLNEDYLAAYIELKKELDCVLLGMAKQDANNQLVLIKNPGAGTKIELNDYLLVISNGISKRKLEKEFNVQEGIMNNE